MPVHDWLCVDAEIFDAFHHNWITEISRALNRGLLPANYYALPEAITGGLGKVVAVRHVSGHQITATVEILSPRNKNNQNVLNAFVRTARDALAAGVHLLLADLFPHGSHDPQGIHPAVWGDDRGNFELPSDKPLTCVAYVAGPAAEAYVQPFAVGDSMPVMPLFLTRETYVQVPLETTYVQAWDGMPEYWRRVLSGDAPS